MLMIFTLLLLLTTTGLTNQAALPALVTIDQIEYKLLAANRTATMEKELNQAAAAGFRFEGVMGGETGLGGNESVVIMSKKVDAPGKAEYKLLATNKTSTMQKELGAAGAAGFLYVGQTVYSSTFGGKEVVAILERVDTRNEAYEYKLLATTRTATMQKELNEAGREGFIFCGVTVAETAFGGKEVVTILRRPIGKK